MSLTIGLVQYSTTHRSFLPYSVGLLQAALQGGPEPERYRFLPPRVLAAPIAAEAEALLEADVVGFSSYVWNEQRNLALARALKARKPEALIVFGGPQVPDLAEDWLRANPCVDLAVHGEGEDVFAALMQAYPARPWDQIAGLSWLAADGSFWHTPPKPKRRDLDAFPSPFLTGVFEPLFSRYPEVAWASTWETNRGCPFTCVFCDWGSATAAKVNRFETERLKAEIDWFSSHRLDYIFCADANFGILPRDVELARHAAEVRVATGFPVSLVVQNAKNVSERTFEIQCLLSDSGLDTQTTISLQSLHPPTLEASGRKNISLAKFGELQQRLKARNMHTYTDLIIGLPEESYDSFADGLATLITSGQYHALQVFCADILPNAPMAAPAFRARYKLETVKIASHQFRTPLREDPDGIVEYQHTIVSTSSMPREDWVRTRALCWLVDLIFFKPGTVRIALMLLHHRGGLGYRRLFETFCAPDPRLRTLDWVWRFFCERARRMQGGESEFIPTMRADGVLYWEGACEAALDMLGRQGRLAAYYSEASTLLGALAREAGLPTGLLEDSLFLSASVVHLQLGQDLYGLRYQTRWNVWDYYQSLLAAEPIALRPEGALYLKDWAGDPYRLRCLPLHSAGARPATSPPGPLAGLRAQQAPRAQP